MFNPELEKENAKLKIKVDYYYNLVLDCLKIFKKKGYKTEEIIRYIPFEVHSFKVTKTEEYKI